MRFGSICSGIEAASVASAPIGWEAAWFAEIEPFPSRVLAHHYPEVPNLGDMLALPARVSAGEVEAPELLCGGTPCQAFSVAGLRKSLDDARGNLSLTFVELADAIDDVRLGRGESPCIVFWENVPGVLNTKDNAFGCFLAGLAGECVPLQPPGDRWADAGGVLGPRRVVAWRVLDAQYFGLAQRRRRVFVVASAREGFDPVAVLLVESGVCRDSAPCREAGEGTAAEPAEGLAKSLRARANLAHRDDADTPIAFGGNNTRGGIDVATACNAKGGTGRADFESETFVMEKFPTLCAGGNATGGDRPPGTDVDTCDSLIPMLTHSLRAAGFDASEDGTGRGTPLIVQEDNQNGVSMRTTAGSLRADAPGTQPCGSLVMQPTEPQAFYSNESPCDNIPPVGMSPSLKIGSNSGGNPPAIAFVQNQRDEVRLDGGDGQAVGALSDERGSHQTPAAAVPGMAIRRLLPVECERLQGFPDGYTAIPGAADSPRYRALGNSWAVPVVRWLFRRIDAASRQEAP